MKVKIPKYLHVLLICIILSTILTFVSSQRAHADPGYIDGVHVVFARGSNDGIRDKHAQKFATSVTESLKSYNLPVAFVELGDLDSNNTLSSSEYPATGGDNLVSSTWNWLVSPGYGNSVRIGTDELVTHLNT